MSRVRYMRCDGVDESGARCEQHGTGGRNWIQIQVLGERFDYCTPHCFRSFGVQLMRLFPGVL